MLPPQLNPRRGSLLHFPTTLGSQGYLYHCPLSSLRMLVTMALRNGWCFQMMMHLTLSKWWCIWGSANGIYTLQSSKVDDRPKKMLIYLRHFVSNAFFDLSFHFYFCHSFLICDVFGPPLYRNVTEMSSLTPPHDIFPWRLIPANKYSSLASLISRVWLKMIDKGTNNRHS